MSTWILLRVAKWLALLLLVAGTAGALLPRDLHDRRRAVYLLVTPGFVLTWFFGYGLARVTGVSLGSTWLSLSMLLSLASLQALVWGVERADRGRALVGAVVTVATIATVGLMTWRPGTLAASEPPTVAEATP